MIERRALLGQKSWGANLLNIISTFLLITSLFISSGLFAQEGTINVETIMVTADKRETELLKLPIAVSVVTGERLQDMQAKSVVDIYRQVPNMFISNWGTRGNSFVFFRGIGSVSNAPAVSFYVDGVSFMDARLFDTGLYDIERVELLRGPQGTLYGQNSLAGVVNVVTKVPGNELRGELSASYGKYKAFTATGSVSGPLVKDKVFLGVAGMWESREGFTFNDYLEKDADKRGDFFGRAQLRLMPTEDWDILLAIDHENLEDGAYPIVTLDEMLANPYHISMDYDGSYHRDTTGGSLKVERHMGFGDFIWIAGYRSFTEKTYNDQDFTMYDMATFYQEVKGKSMSQELRIVSQGDGPFKWLVGLYYFDDKRDDLQNGDYKVYELFDSSLSEVRNKGFAGFFQGSYAFSELFELTVGLRYERDTSRIKYSAESFYQGSSMGYEELEAEHSDGVFMPKIQLAVYPTEEMMAYFSVAKGYRAGGFNTASNLPHEYRFFEPEESWNYELGLKGSFLDGKFNLGFSLFLIELRDMQTTKTLPTQNTYVNNAGKAQSRGAELEFSAILPSGFSILGSLGVTHAEFKEYSDEVSGMDYSGNRNQLSPTYNTSLSLEYLSPRGIEVNLFGKPDELRFFGRVDWTNTGPFYWDIDNSIREDAYGLLNLSLGLKSESLDVIVWGHNVLDKRYAAVAFSFGGPSPMVQPGDPRTFGVTVRARF